VGGAFFSNVWSPVSLGVKNPCGHSAGIWEDAKQSAATNEVCINWQAALVYALAGFNNNQSQ
jgi:hypothetical protein